MTVRIIGKEEPKPDLQERLGGASLLLGGASLLLGGASLLLGGEVHLGGLEKCLNPVSGPLRRSSTPRRALLRLGVGVSG